MVALFFFIDIVSAAVDLKPVNITESPNSPEVKNVFNESKRLKKVLSVSVYCN